MTAGIIQNNTLQMLRYSSKMQYLEICVLTASISMIAAYTTMALFVPLTMLFYSAVEFKGP
jgi:hypothetical protein